MFMNLDRTVCTGTAAAISIFGRGPNASGWRRLAATPTGIRPAEPGKASFSGKDRAGGPLCCCLIVESHILLQQESGRLSLKHQAS